MSGVYYVDERNECPIHKAANTSRDQFAVLAEFALSAQPSNNPKLTNIASYPASAS